MKRIFSSQVKNFLDKEVLLCGWLSKKRDHGKVIFFDLRDKEGLVQLVFPVKNEEVFNQAKEMEKEWVVKIVGRVKKRPKGTENKNLVSGQFEIEVKEVEVFSQAKTLPFSIEDDGYQIKEETRLKYRYLDLRRERLKNNLFLKAKTTKVIRDFLEKNDFLEIETPYLSKSTPEGARDYLVPSRLEPGKFYALTQSPQQYKQLLMVAGFEKYYQFARCFRDEDTRGDRQPEFTQVDLEISFAEEEEILALVEKLILEIVNKVFPEKKIAKIPFPRITYQEAIEKFKTDKPNLSKEKNELFFCFIVNFPMFEKKKGKWEVTHHPFTLPKEKDPEKIKKNPEKILAHQYDLVLNGEEIGGGSLRSFQPEILEAVFEVIGYPKRETRKQFGHLLEAFKYGVPPHGGIAFGLERLLATILGEKSIREVMAFPKTGEGRDLMMGAPSSVSENQLKELSIQIKSKKGK